MSSTADEGGTTTGTWRYTSVWALILAGSLVGVHMMVEYALRKEVEATTEQANNTFTRVLVNDNWTQLRPMLALDEPNPNPIRNPQLPEIDQLMRSFAKGTDLVKVKIYNASGLTLYSSDPKQIGEDKASNGGFQAASRGLIATELTFRGKFGAFDGELFDRNLVSSYVPVRGASAVEAVVEVYTDRTPSIQAAAERTRTVVLAIGSGLVLLFLIAAWTHAHQRRALRRLLESTARQQSLSAAATPAVEAHSPAWAAAAEALSAVVPAETASALWADLRRLACLEAGLEPPARGPVAVWRLTQEQVGAWRQKAQQRDLEVLDNLSLPPDAMAQGSDEARYAEMLQRLLQHGLTALASGNLQLKVQAAPGHLELDLIATGTPTDPTLDGHRTREALNLAVARALVRSLRGDFRREQRQEPDARRHSDWVAVNLPWSLQGMTGR